MSTRVDGTSVDVKGYGGWTFVDVMTNGFGVMYDYSDRILPEDRWAIVAYVRVLQQSQATNVSELTPEERAKLDAIPTSTTNGPSTSTGQ